MSAPTLNRSGQPAATARPFASLRVLIADDNPDAADTLAEVLAMDLGCTVVTAYDGHSALQRALAERPEVLILDVRMPDFGGVDVVRELRRIGSAADAGQGQPSALFVAVTGNDVSGVLTDVDSSFDAAFAKPVDVQAVASLLRRHWQGKAESTRHAPIELSDLLCQVARRSAPMLRGRGHVLCFDYRGPSLLVEVDEAAMHAGLHRLLCGVVDMLDAGFTMLKASVQPGPSGDWTLLVHIAAAGAALAPVTISEVLARLDLVDVLGAPPVGAAAARTATGTCPRSGAQVHCVVAPSDGVLFRFETSVQPLQVVDITPDAQGARVWIIDPALIPSALLQRRLQRLGWQVRRFDSFAPALERAAQLSLESIPELVIVMEGSDGEGDAWVDLQAQLPPGAQYVRVVAIGSALLREADDGEACSVRVDPVSPRELVELTQRLGRAGKTTDSAPAEFSLTASAGLQDRPRLLVVDDSEINRIVASGLAAALGYEVAVVADGLDAIRHCKQSAPDVVLMDVNMPILGGIDATEHIRSLQRLGKVSPFPIVAATANDDPQTRDRCRQVGMDGFVSKPLMLQTLREELRRVTLNAPH